MESAQVLKQIQTQEQQAQEIIEEARGKASSIIREAKFIKRNEILKAAQDEAEISQRKIIAQFKKQTQEGIQQIEQEAHQTIESIKNTSSQKQERARDYIVEAVLQRWQLQR